MLENKSALQKILFFLFINLAIVSMACSAYAVECTSATVIQAGPAYYTDTNGNPIEIVNVVLRNDSGSTVGTWANGTQRRFKLFQSIDSKGLATMLTAFSLDRPVYVLIPNANAAAGAYITRVYIK